MMVVAQGDMDCYQSGVGTLRPSENAILRHALRHDFQHSQNL